MSEREKKSALPVIIGGLIVTPILYVLSVGPTVCLAIWLDRRDLMPEFIEQALNWFYLPLFWLCDEGPAPIGDALDWYVKLWI
jgi:hypothetical protein